jgi:hypothetical protein
MDIELISIARAWNRRPSLLADQAVSSLGSCVPFVSHAVLVLKE